MSLTGGTFPRRARRLRVGAAVLAALLAAGPVRAGVLVLVDGRALRHRGALRLQGEQVHFDLEDGTLASLRRDEVDWEATARVRDLLSGYAEAQERLAQTPPRPRPAGPREFEALPEANRLDALLHTGRRPREPARGEAGAGAIPPCGPPRLPGRYVVVDLLLAPEAGPDAPRGTLGPAGETEPPVRFSSPRDGDAVAGVVSLEASAGGAADLVAVDYYVDGMLVGRSEAEPWNVPWSVPADRRRHRLEARLRERDGTSRTAQATVESFVADLNVNVELVPLIVTVTNHEYLFVRDLEAREFRIYEDGVRQEVAHFSRVPVPLTLLVLADVSWSMKGKKLGMLRAGLERLVDRLEREDRVGVAVFAESFRLIRPPGLDHRAALEALDGLEADGGTAMFDAELEALRVLEPEGGRRVLLVVGDGEDYMSRARIEDVLEAASRQNIAIYALGTLSYRMRDGLPEHWSDGLLNGRASYWSERLRVRGLKFLTRQADATGGVLYLPKFAGELPYVFEHLLAELKSSYSLGYYPKLARRDGRFHTIKVTVDAEGLAARSRAGYYAPAPPRRAARGPLEPAGPVSARAGTPR